MRAVQALALAFFTASCAGYVSVPARVASAGGTRVRVERLVRLLQATTLDLTVEQTAPQTRLREAVLARENSDPCRFGWAATVMNVTDRDWRARRGDEPMIATGDHIALMFGADLNDRVEKGVRLDLVIVQTGHEQCLSIPITTTARELRWQRDPGLSADVAVGGSGFVGSVGGVVAELPFTLALSHPLGDLRVYGGSGIGAVFCSERVCPPQVVDQGTPSERREQGAGLEVPLFLGFDTMPWQTGLFAFGTAVEYDVDYVRLHTYGTPRTEWLHGPVVAPRIALTFRDPMAPGLSGGPRNGFLAVDVPLGVIQIDSPSLELAPRAGVRLLVSMPLR